MKQFLFYLFILFFIHSHLDSLQWIHNISEGGYYTEYSSKWAPFPHPDRNQGLTYQGIYYPLKGHFDQDRIFVYVPENLDPSQLNFVFYFHGWFGSINDSLERFDIIKQFAQSHVNAVLVIPETAVDAPDFFGGKLEGPDGFKRLVNELIEYLVMDQWVKTKSVNEIILAGHSGSYRVISGILKKGGLTGLVNEVYLLDALYGNREIFIKWLKQGERKLVVFSTKAGGTRAGVMAFSKTLKKKNIEVLVEKDAKNPRRWNRSTLIFCDELGHEDVINPYLRILLEMSRLKKRTDP